MALQSWLKRGKGSQLLLINNTLMTKTVIRVIHYHKEPQNMYT